LGRKEKEVKWMERKIRAVAIFTVLLILFGGVFIAGASAAPKDDKADEAKKVAKEIARDIAKKTNEKTPKKIPVEIMSEEIVEERTLENGMKVVEIKQKIRMKKIDIEKALDEEMRKELGKKLDELPEVIELEVNVVKTGFGSITYGNELYKTLACIDTVPVSASDPVNLIFYNVGSAWDVQYDMQNWLTYQWSGDADGCNLMAYIDNTAHGGSATWIQQHYQLEYGNYETTRRHIRIFDGGYDTHGEYGDYSIAGVHYEEWVGLPQGHNVLSWEDAESFVADDFADEDFVGQVYGVDIGNEGYYQGVWNDGEAQYIELLW
jgi:hypothetical protein